MSSTSPCADEVIINRKRVVFWTGNTDPRYIPRPTSAPRRRRAHPITDGLAVIFSPGHQLRNPQIPAFQAVILGRLITCWLLIVAFSPLWLARFSRFCPGLEKSSSRRATTKHFAARAPGQQGTYMGFAFLPIGIGSLIGRIFAAAHASLRRSHAPVPAAWWVIPVSGVLTALFCGYDPVIKPVKR